MKVYKTITGIFIESEGKIYAYKNASWDGFINQDDLYKSIAIEIREAKALGSMDLLKDLNIQAPIESQEIWAAGVTYTRSRDARMEESKDSGGGSFYDHV